MKHPPPKMYNHRLFSFLAIMPILALGIFNGCSSDYSANIQEEIFIPSKPPIRETPQAIPELFIYTKGKVRKEDTEAYFYFFDASKHFSTFSSTDNFESPGYIKVRGNSTATSPKKPYNIKFENKIDFFGMGKAKKWALLSNPFDPTLIRNKLIYDLASNLSFIYSQESYFIDVWVNDSFMGNYQIAEKVEFQKHRIPYDVDNGDYLFELVDSEKRNKADVIYFQTPVKNLRITLTEPEEPSSEQMDDFQKKMERIEKAIASKDFSEYVKYVDLKSMIDYYWVEEFVNDPDLHTGSLFFTIHDGIMRGGPVWDFDLSLGNTQSEDKASTEGFNAQKYWWRELFQDPTFQKIAYERYLQIEPYFDNLANDNDLGKNKIDSLLNYFGESFQRNYSDSGWAYCDTLNEDAQNKRQLTCPYNPIPQPTFDENILYLREWITQRNKYIKETASRRLRNLKDVELSLDRALEIQDSIFASD